jgi:Domain of unknown function (DUF4438), N-terminal/Domain of unknown function (DUF4438), C-terminal
MLKTNESKLVKNAVVTEVAPPPGGPVPYRITEQGELIALPGVGSITYNVKVGDCALGLAADHVEPSVSTKAYGNAPDIVARNRGINTYAQAGNDAIVISGDAKGAKGRVTGKHGGIEHVIIDFSDKDMNKMAIGDKIQIRCHGLGMELLDYPNIKAMNLDPRLLKKMGLKELGDGKIEVDVAKIVPAAIMGSGLGASQCYTGDYDIQLFDKKIRKQYKLDDLCFGDIVLIENADHSYGRTYITGAASVGIVVHSDCVISGHGPGVMTLLASREGNLIPKITKDANIANYLKIGRQRKSGKAKK